MCTGVHAGSLLNHHVGRRKVRFYPSSAENEIMQKETHDLESNNYHSSLGMVVLLDFEWMDFLMNGYTDPSGIGLMGLSPTTFIPA